jgi:hypothetical protein
LSLVLEHSIQFKVKLLSLFVKFNANQIATNVQVWDNVLFANKDSPLINKEIAQYYQFLIAKCSPHKDVNNAILDSVYYQM